LPLIRHLFQVSLLKSAGFGKFLNTGKVLDARRRGATIEGNAADDALMVDQDLLKAYSFPSL
jgi:hypothetical protein